MTDKERLEDIEKRFRWGEDNLGNGSLFLEKQHVLWLLKKAKEAVEGEA